MKKRKKRKKKKKTKKTSDNNQQTLYIKALRAFILSRLIVCTFEEEDAL